MIEILVGGSFVALTVVATLAIYGLSRIALIRFADDDTKDLAGSVIFRVSAMHGLILALVFAQELRQYDELRDELMREASVAADLWNDIERYGGPQRAVVQSAIRDYAREVAGPEWDRLASADRLSADGWAERELIYQAVLDLMPNTPRETALREHMLDAIHTIATLRDVRAAEAIYTMPGLFWVAALGGVALVTVPYFTFPPTVLNLTLLGIFGAYSGLVMFLIFAFSDPYSEPARLAPTPFERLLATDMGGT